MPAVPVAVGAVVLMGASVVGTLALLGLCARVRYVHHLPSFRCRLATSAVGRRRRRSPWSRHRTWAAWVDGALLVRSGPPGLWLTPLSVTVRRESSVRALGPREVRGLGPRPVALRFVLSGGRELELAVARTDAERLVGPFLTTALSGSPDARQEHG